ncbi:hypothetical protein [Rhizobium mesosinicum]|uniref:Uncharacterized protein n=1 Tax=Rhizobium mesosinicum TaxID=335017 RepID=A0ABS7H1W2_9HYPH|nr:hypothetical protein [Rhizobium mesosinicum]MBW9056166.1 hypothetical protein [Rhizobium mesosinicum]
MQTMPDLRELQETRLRLEARYLPNSPFRQSYERLCRRFENDLADERDRLLSQCASLMLIRFIQEDIADATD